MSFGDDAQMSMPPFPASGTGANEVPSKWVTRSPTAQTLVGENDQSRSVNAIAVGTVDHRFPSNRSADDRLTVIQMSALEVPTADSVR